MVKKWLIAPTRSNICINPDIKVPKVEDKLDKLTGEKHCAFIILAFTESEWKTWVLQYNFMKEVERKLQINISQGAIKE